MNNEYKWCVYKHTSPSGKYYIGITSIKPEYRWNHGRNYKEKDQKIFYNAIKKYGWDNFKHEILADKLGEKTAKNVEKDLIRFAKKLKMSYNITDGGDGALGLRPMLGKKHSKETLKKLSESHKGLFVGDKNPMYDKHETVFGYGKYGHNHQASKSINQYSLDGKYIRTFGSLVEAVRSLGLTIRSVTHITACAKGKQKTALGYIWRYNKVDNFTTVLSKQVKSAVQYHKKQRLNKLKMKPKTTSNNK